MKTTEEKITVMQAYKQGKKIECFSNDRWDDWISKAEPSWDWWHNDYRIKKAPELRAWTFNEVPVGCAIRLKMNKDIKGVILRSGNSYVTSSIGNNQFNLDALLDYEYSIDFGKTWLPCGVME